MRFALPRTALGVLRLASAKLRPAPQHGPQANRPAGPAGIAETARHDHAIAAPVLPLPRIPRAALLRPGRVGQASASLFHALPQLPRATLPSLTNWLFVFRMMWDDEKARVPFRPSRLPNLSVSFRLCLDGSCCHRGRLTCESTEQLADFREPLATARPPPRLGHQPVTPGVFADKPGKKAG